MQKYFLLILMLACILVPLYIFQQSIRPEKPCYIRTTGPCLVTTTRVIDGKKYTLYIADTDEKRQQGLSGMKDLPDDAGLLFVFDTPGFHSFWMKDMHFSLDLIFYRDGKEVDRLKDISPDSYPKIFTAKEKFDEAIEIKARR